MRRFKMLVFSEPFEGREAEFDAGYTGRQLDDSCALPGFATAQRLKLRSGAMGKTLNNNPSLYDKETEFVEWRNHVASLVLLPADVNRSLQAKPFSQKRAHYAKQNFYAASLDASAYVHQPQFQQFAAVHQFPFKAFEIFTKEEQMARRELVSALVEHVWSPARLREAVA